jgi:hypothetical protein
VTGELLELLSQLKNKSQYSFSFLDWRGVKKKKRRTRRGSGQERNEILRQGELVTIAR